jgi:nucleoside-diphosphate-sugar epimerase
MHVLVTGATGFLGRHAVSALQSAGHDVIALVREGAKSPAKESVIVDLLAPGAVTYIVENVKADALLHLAWVTSHGAYWSDPVNLNWASVSLELVAAMVARGTRRICVAGTCFEYDWPVDGNCDEFNTGTASHTLYDTTKDACRRVLSRFAVEKQLSFAWARLFHLYGPVEHPDRLVSSICRSLVAGRPAECSSGMVLRDFMDVRDAGAALAELAVSEVVGPVNVASGEVARVRDIATTLGQLAGRPDLIRIGAIPDRPKDPMRITANTRRLNREVRFSGSRPLKSGLSDSLTFWRAQQLGSPAIFGEPDY